MPNYDFHELTWQDFEVLARDLVQAKTGVFFESFKPGKDGGRDFRHSTAKKNDKIVGQVKYYLGTGYDGLLKVLKKEAVKVKNLNPDRYILVTSVPLNNTEKNEIISVIGKKYLISDDILGPGELNNLLGKHEEIETKHFKLWLTSTPVLERVLHNAERTQSGFRVKEIHENAKRYVQSDAYPKALERLEEDQVIIITGQPGVGKTTLADLLLYTYVEKSFEPVLINSDVSEGLKFFKKGKDQIFHFDDFMGMTFLGEQSVFNTPNYDRALISFIEMIKDNPGTRLVLTTRDHILAQAIDKSERFKSSSIEDHKLILRMPDYSHQQKARILYNHLYFSDLPKDYIAVLLEDDFYLKIVSHDKFNPRLIQWLSTFRRIKTVKPENFQIFVLNLLKDPSEIWLDAYRNQISDAARSMLLTIFSYGGKSSGKVFQDSFKKLHKYRGENYGFKRSAEDFRKAFRELAGTFLTQNGKHAIEVIDPSVMDLMNRVVSENPDNAIDILKSAFNFQQIAKVRVFAKSANRKEVMARMVSEIDSLLPHIALLATEERQRNLGGGVTGYLAPSYEERLNAVLNMSCELPNEDWANVVNSIFNELLTEWDEIAPNVQDAIGLRQTFFITSKATGLNYESQREKIKEKLLSDLTEIDRAEDIADLAGLLTSKQLASKTFNSRFQNAFHEYETSSFSAELRSCGSSESYDGLFQYVKDLGEMLSIDVDDLLNEITEEHDLFDNYQQEYADQAHDEWREARYEEQIERGEISDMFSTLKE